MLFRSSLNLYSPEGLRIFSKLASKVDAVIESFQPDHLKNLGLGYDHLSRENPGLVMTSITGFGQYGPYSSFLASDLVALAMSGLLYVSGDPKLPPCKPPESQSYYLASAYAAFATLIALYHRVNTGEGQHVDVSIQETLSVMEGIVSSFANHGRILRRCGARHKFLAPANIFECKDGYIFLMIGSRKDWRGLLDIWPEHPKDFEEEKWNSVRYRKENENVIEESLTQFMRHHTKKELVNLSRSKGIAGTIPANAPIDFVNDEHIVAASFFHEVIHSVLGKYSHPGVPYRLNGMRPVVRPAPSIGQNNQEIYGSIGIKPAELSHLKSQGII